MRRREKGSKGHFGVQICGRINCHGRVTRAKCGTGHVVHSGPGVGSACVMGFVALTTVIFFS